MQRAIVHVTLYGEKRGHDLEVPTEVDIAELAMLLAAALEQPYDPSSPDGGYELIVPLAEGPLAQSLAEAGLWDGTSLVLRRRGRAT